MTDDVATLDIVHDRTGFGGVSINCGLDSPDLRVAFGAGSRRYVRFVAAGRAAFTEQAQRRVSKVRRELRDALREIHDRVGLTSIFVTHDYEEAFALADKVAILGQGRIEQFDTPEMVQSRPASDYVREFLS